MCKFPLQTLRLLYLLHAFKGKYRNFKKLCETKSQKYVIESDSFLKDLYFQSATEFIKDKKISDVAKSFLSEGIFMCTFLPLSKVSAFDFMRLCLGLIMPAYEFTFLEGKATEEFKEKIIIDSVVKITKDDRYEIETKSGVNYRARNIVLAVPPAISKKLLPLKKFKAGANAYVFHVEGKLKNKWNGGQFELFNSNSSVIFIRKQADSTYIFYSRKSNLELDKYFTHPKVLFKKHWEPAFNITGDVILEAEQEERLYLVGDHNVIGLEDSYITGLFAANRIMSKTG